MTAALVSTSCSRTAIWRWYPFVAKGTKLTRTDLDWMLDAREALRDALAANNGGDAARPHRGALAGRGALLRAGRGPLPTLRIYVAQLVLNGAWSWLFFGLHRPGLAFAEILVLAAVIAVNAAMFWKERPLAGALLLPYLAWVSFAAVLNFALWRLNL